MLEKFITEIREKLKELNSFDSLGKIEEYKIIIQKEFDEVITKLYKKKEFIIRGIEKKA